jgi:hypothetical protein
MRKRTVAGLFEMKRMVAIVVFVVVKLVVVQRTWCHETVQYMVAIEIVVISMLLGCCLDVDGSMAVVVVVDVVVASEAVVAVV